MRTQQHTFTIPRDLRGCETLSSWVYRKGNVQGTVGGPNGTLHVYADADRAEVQTWFDEAVQETRVQEGL